MNRLNGCNSHVQPRLEVLFVVAFQTAFLALIDSILSKDSLRQRIAEKKGQINRLIQATSAERTGKSQVIKTTKFINYQCSPNGQIHSFLVTPLCCSYFIINPN